MKPKYPNMYVGTDYTFCMTEKCCISRTCKRAKSNYIWRTDERVYVMIQPDVTKEFPKCPMWVEAV